MRLPGIPGKRINLARKFVRVLNESNALKCGCVRTRESVRRGGGGNVTSCASARFVRELACKGACIPSKVACVPV